MSTLLEIGRYGLEGVEVLFAFATVAALGAGMVFGRHQEQTGGDEAAAHQG
jgi:hypothetical protein